MRLLAFAATTIAVCLSPSIARACSHVIGASCRGVVVAPPVAAAPTDTRIVVQVENCSREPTTLLQLRRSDGTPVDATVDVSRWNLGSGVTLYLSATTVRLIPRAPLAPETRYEVWTLARDSTDVDRRIFQFVTAVGPLLGPGPAATDAALNARSVSSSCSLAECCGEMELQLVDLVAAREDLLYTITRLDGTVVAADVPANTPGLVVCNGNAYVDRPRVWPLWILEDQGEIALRISARDLVGRESPSVDATITACASGCSATDPAGPAAAVLVLGAARSRRRRATRSG